MSHYTHENVPEEVAKKFPHLQGKKMISKKEVPTHVVESAEKNGKPITVQQAQPLQPQVVAQKAHPIVTHPALHKSVVHHSPPAKHTVVTHAQATAVVANNTTVTKEVPQAQIQVLGKDHDATVTHKAPIVHKTSAVKHVVQHHPVQQHTVQHAPVVIGQSQVKVGAQVAHKAAFTHENVPEEVHKKFPHLQTKVTHTIKVGGVNGNHTTIKSPEKVAQPKINVVHASEHLNEQQN
ncbi:hypothetical protein TTHERM_00105580 (macronuclear) [Tetrahymena thermophila SB210]|uniref:Uncharacterized protein n=1 Tax=Tetrahymena thermophila (strain SB210) TaxID=312017 RepID=Q234E0_TETTS|nr:hypothetical protein TTHERM_00105580 [Tetrahymena thermophila SB210]EAR92063.1 hypothetical protein TTHERM_00105580 [Tetrahymena thermophila SB210]|eukprot:XP_001012308.1 hypothetical protein TTHERM_00105580 [Tetrahymena thermophila SB210]